MRVKITLTVSDEQGNEASITHVEKNENWVIPADVDMLVALDIDDIVLSTGVRINNLIKKYQGN